MKNLAFLLAYIQDAKTSNRKWTFGMWVNQLGLKDTSSITKIVQGSRHPGAAITEALIKYFRDLVHLHKIKQDPRLSVLLLEKMGKLNEFFEDPEWISKKQSKPFG